MKPIHILLGCLIAATYLSAAPVAPASISGHGVSLGAGSKITLMADPGISTLRVPLPEAFTRLKAEEKAAKAATVTINFLPAGSSLAQWGDHAIAWPNDAKAAVMYAASVWAALLNSSVPIVINAAWVDNLGSGVLGHSGSVTFSRDFTGAPVAGTWYPATLANTLHGSDIDISNPDIYMGFSSTFSWYTGTDGATPGDKYDLISVVLHEICHGLGFAGSMTVSSGNGSWGMGTGYPIAYDRFNENGIAQLLITAFVNPSAALGTQLTSGSIYFNGAKATAANGGSHPKLYAPATWRSGSSIAHLDEEFNGTANALMTYSLGFGESIHNPGPVTMGLLGDVGWPAGGIGVFTVSKLKAKVYWERKPAPNGLLPTGVGDIIIVGSTPSALTSLTPLDGVSLGSTFLIKPPETPGCIYGGNTFIKLNGSATKASFGSSVPGWKWKWTYTVWLSKGRLWVKGQGKYMWNQGLPAFGLTNVGCDWTTKTLTINMDIVGGGMDIHAVGSRKIQYKTKDGKTSTIK